jgi:CAAX prenyl protease-like protein
MKRAVYDKEVRAATARTIMPLGHMNFVSPSLPRHFFWSCFEGIREPVPSQILPDPEAPAAVLSTSRWTQWLTRHPWLPYVLPFAVFMLTGWLGPDRPPGPSADESAAAVNHETSSGAPGPTESSAEGLRPRGYALAYTFQIAATLCAMLLVAPSYWSVPWRLSGLAVVYGVVGAFVWIVICRCALEDRFWTAIGRADWMDYAARPAFNPLTAFQGSPFGLAAFLTIRFAGLAAVVPLIEEFFLRGFLMRFFLQADWWTIPLGTVTRASAAVATIYGVLSHPAEPIAAAIWFSLITLLYARTRNLWDCVVAHAVTNGLLGIYVLTWRDWALW